MTDICNHKKNARLLMQKAAKAAAMSRIGVAMAVFTSPMWINPHKELYSRHGPSTAPHRFSAWYPIDSFELWGPATLAFWASRKWVPTNPYSPLELLAKVEDD